MKTIAAITIACVTSIPTMATSQTSNGDEIRCLWPRTNCEVSVEIDGYDFDFETPRAGRGIVDGPFSHNGKYRILKNRPGCFEMRAHFGTDARQSSDMDVVLRIQGTRAVVSGTVKGKSIGTVTTKVRQEKGEVVLEFQSCGKRRGGKPSCHVIRWTRR